jgi:hypothetical protein
VLLEGPLERSHPSHLLLEFCFGRSIRFVQRLSGIFEVMKLTELMGNIWKHKGHRTPDRLFPVGKDAFDRDLEKLQKLLDAPLARP